MPLQKNFVADHPRFLLWGAGGHGKVVADVVRAAGGLVAGYVDGNPEKLGCVAEEGGARVVATESALFEALRAGRLPAEADALALALGDNDARLRALEALAHVAVPALIHPSAQVSPSAQIGRGTLVMPRAVVNASARVGAAAIVNTGAIIEHDCVTEDGVHISPCATLCGGVRVGRGSWVAAGSVVVPGVTIGSGATVGAGAVVVRNVPAGSVVVGNPAKFLRSAK